MAEPLPSSLPKLGWSLPRSRGSGAPESGRQWWVLGVLVAGLRWKWKQMFDLQPGQEHLWSRSDCASQRILLSWGQIYLGA